MPYQGHYRPPPQPFVGGRQPSEPRKLTPPSYIPDDPPLGHRMRMVGFIIPAIILAWQPGPPLPTLAQQLPPVIANYVPDNPPFAHEARILPNVAIVRQAWEPGPPYIRIVRTVPQPPAAVQADDPPFDSEQRVDLMAIDSGWRVPGPMPQQAARDFTPGYVPDDPTFSRMPPPWLFQAIRAWDAQPPLPTIGAKLTQPAAAAQTDDPPFGQRPWLTTAILSWQPGPPLPSRPTWLVQPYLPDSPPLGYRPWLSSAVQTWQPGPPKPYVPEYVVQPEVVAQVDNPPIIGGDLSLPVILRAWQPGPPLPWRPRWLVLPFIPPPVDNPPFGFRCHDGLSFRRDWWQPPIVRHRYNTVVQDGGIPAVGGFIFTQIRNANQFVVALRDRSQIVASKGQFFIVERRGD